MIADVAWSIVAGVLLILGVIGLFAYWRWLGEEGERRHAARDAAETFDRDFIPESPEVIKHERALLQAVLLTQLGRIDDDRKAFNAQVRAYVRGPA